MTAITAPMAPNMGPAVAAAPLLETVAGPVEVGEPEETEPLLETTEVTIVVLFLLDEIVATEDATGAVVVALLTEETTPLPPPWEGVRPPDWTAEVAAVDAEAKTDAEADGDADEPEPWAAEVEAGVVAEEDGAGQLRSNSGVVLNVEPTIPKLGLGVIG